MSRQFLEHAYLILLDNILHVNTTDPMEQDLTAFVKDAEHLDDRAANYVRLMDTREEVLQLDAKEDLED